MKAIVINKVGGSGVLKLEEVADPKPKKDEVVIKQTAIGVNFFDICFRNGTYKLPQLPAVLGMEGVGIIQEVGSGVTDFKVGERVAYATGGIGAYAEKKVIHQHHLVIVPQTITDVQAAGVLLKGMMAHTLLHRVYVAARIKRILVHSAAGGVGHILCQLAKYLNIEVIGTVGDDKKIPTAKMAGCDHVINYKTANLVEEVAKLTEMKGVGLVYDGIGKDTLEKSLQCLWPMGMCISFGDASGKYENFNIDLLSANSLYLTRPTLALYKANRLELTLSAAEIFAAVEKGIVKPQITTFNFKDVAKAHESLESRASTGSLVLTF